MQPVMFRAFKRVVVPFAYLWRVWLTYDAVRFVFSL
jgi:hypothetical protein